MGEGVAFLWEWQAAVRDKRKAAEDLMMLKTLPCLSRRRVCGSSMIAAGQQHPFGRQCLAVQYTQSLSFSFARYLEREPICVALG